MYVNKEILNDYIKNIDFLLGGNRDFYNSIKEDDKEPFKIKYHWRAAHPDYTDIEDWEEATAYQDMITDFSHSVLGWTNYDKFVELGTILREKYGQYIPLFASIYYKDEYIGALLITEETIHLINENINTFE